MNYYVDSFGTWFVVTARTKREARKVGTAEFGRGMVREVRQATDEEVKEFVRLKGERALRAD